MARNTSPNSTQRSGGGEARVQPLSQRRRAQISAATGYNINVVFDAPFYKLRGGGWTTKKAADDKARELSVYNINALVVKLR